VLLKIARFE